MGRSCDDKLEGGRHPREAHVRNNALPNTLGMDVYVNELRRMRRTGVAGPKVPDYFGSVTRQVSYSTAGWQNQQGNSTNVLTIFLSLSSTVRRWRLLVLRLKKSAG